MTEYGPEYMRARLVWRISPVLAEEPGNTMKESLRPVTLLQGEGAGGPRHRGHLPDSGDWQVVTNTRFSPEPSNFTVNTPLFAPAGNIW